MSNVEYFQHLVDNCDEGPNKWVLQEQLQKETRRVAKKRIADRLEREKAETPIETPTLEDKPKRGRKPTNPQEE